MNGVRFSLITAGSIKPQLGLNKVCTVLKHFCFIIVYMNLDLKFLSSAESCFTGSTPFL